MQKGATKTRVNTVPLFSAEEGETRDEASARTGTGQGVGQPDFGLRLIRVTPYVVAARLLVGPAGELRHGERARGASWWSHASPHPHRWTRHQPSS